MSEGTAVPAADDKVDPRVIEHIRTLRKDCPADADVLMDLTRRGVVHTQRLRWAYFWLRVASTLLGFGALVVMGIVSTQFVRAGAVVPAGVSLGIGAGTVVAIFVTGKTPPAMGARGSRRDEQQSS